LAEDHVINQKVAISMLRGMGCEPTVAVDGRKALDAWQAGAFDLILMDIQMPEMDGFEAMAAIRAREREIGGHVPIVALTAHAMKGDRERCLEAGFDDHLAKPIHYDRLVEVVGRFLNDRQWPLATSATLVMATDADRMKSRRPRGVGKASPSS
jgi:CheY-like chemotaxis protein